MTAPTHVPGGAAARRPRHRLAARPPVGLRRRLVAALVALGLALGLGAAAAQGTADAGAAGAAAPSGTATAGAEVELTSQVFRLARQLRCPVCVSESVGDSNAAIAVEMRGQIREQLEAGRSEAEILAFFQERYGDWILLEPPRRGVHLFVWWLPRVALAAGVLGLAGLMLRWTRAARRAQHETPPPPEDLARVRAALDEEGRA